MAKITVSGGGQTPSNRAQGNNLGQSNNAQAQQSQPQNSNQSQNAGANNLLLTRGEEERARVTPETGNEWWNNPRVGRRKPTNEKKKDGLSRSEKFQIYFKYIFTIALGAIIAISAYISHKEEFNGERSSGPKTDREKVDEINEDFRKAQEQRYNDSINNSTSSIDQTQDDKFEFEFEANPDSGGSELAFASGHADFDDNKTFILTQVTAQEAVAEISQPAAKIQSPSMSA